MHAMGDMDLRRESVDRAVARLATRQHGVVRLDQLKACGMPQTMLRDRLRHGRLHRIHPCVYAVGHVALSFEGRVRGLLLAAGGDSFVSGLASLYLRDVVRREPATIDVVVRRHTRPLRGSRIIHSHCCARQEAPHRWLVGAPRSPRQRRPGRPACREAGDECTGQVRWTCQVNPSASGVLVEVGGAGTGRHRRERVGGHAIGEADEDRAASLAAGVFEQRPRWDRMRLVVVSGLRGAAVAEEDVFDRVGHALFVPDTAAS